MALGRAVLFLLFVTPLQSVFSQVDTPDDLPSLNVQEAPSIRIDNLGLRDGLSQGSIYEITQDKSGFVWFGTQGGLHKYDGHEFTVYETVAFDTTSISDGWIWGVTATEDGSIWAGTSQGGLNRLDPVTGTFQHFTHDRTDSTTISGGRVFKTFEASDGTIWVGTDDGLNRLDEERRGIFTRFDHVHDDSTTVASGVFFIREDPDGYLWLSTSDGIDRFDPDTGEVKHHFWDREHSSPSQEGSFLDSAVDPDDPYVFWYGFGEGIMRFDTRTGDHEQWNPYPEDPPGSERNACMRLVNDPYDANILWVSTFGGGLLRFDRANEVFSAYLHDPQDPNSPASNAAQQVFADRSGTMWVGYGNVGLGKFNPTSVRIAHLEHSPDEAFSPLAAGNTWGIAEAGGRLWIGNDTDAGDDVLTRFDLGTGAVSRRKADNDNPDSFWQGTISAILLGSDGRLWLGTAGVSWCDPESLVCRKLPRANRDSTKHDWRGTHALYEAPSEPGIIWSGSLGGGVKRYDTVTREVSSYIPVPGDSTTSPFAIAHLMEASDGAIWVGSMDAGLARLDRESGTFERYSYNPLDTLSVADNHIEVVLERASEPGILWLATQKGLDRFDIATHRTSHFDETKGLANNHLYGLLEDEDGLLWMSSNRGISSFDPATETFRNYGLDDGLRELEFMQNGFSNGAGGMLYFADVSGITAFVPSQLTTNPAAPPIALTQLRVDGNVVRPRAGGILERPITDTQRIELPYSLNGFSVDFVALHFSDPSKNQFAYQLVGYDDNVIDAGFLRTASYTNLPPGDYTLQVKAANPDGIWNEEGLALAVTILPPWYRTAWAYGLFALLLGLAVYGVDRVQRYRLLRKERSRAELQEAELRAEAAESEAKALQAENARKQNIERLSEIGKEITSSLDFETIFGRLYAHINDLTDAPIFGVGIYDSDSRTIDYRMAIEDGKRYAPYTRDASDKNQFPVWCIENRKPVFINDIANEYQRYIEHYAEQGGKLEDGTESKQPNSLIYLPLSTQDRVLGVITVQSFAKGAYTENDLNLLQTMAAYASVALDNANAYRQLNGTIAELRQTQEQLVQQEKMASLGQLTAGIAHEIKNPLNFVTNFADVNAELATELRELLDGSDTAAIAEKKEEIDDLVAGLQLNAKQIAKHGKRADSIVKGMMEHARPGDAERFSVSVNGFVEEYVNLAWHGYKARFPDMSAPVRRHFGADVGNAKVSPQEMGRVLINLVGNALDVVRDREDGELTVSTARNADRVEIRISDNGPGVPETLKSKIFEPFFTTKPTGEGTGLGLSMSHDIVTQGHGGTMRVEDNAGGGATFVISLPA